MKILSQCALASVLFSIAQACATPVEISDDIQEVNPDSLGDSGVPAGGQGSGGSAGNAGIGQGGSGPSGSGGIGSSGSSGAGGQPGGIGGTGSGGGAAGVSGAGGAAAGAGGAGGAAGTTGTAGTGGTGSASVFDAAACNFGSITGCEAFACATACPPNNGTYCATACNAIITCVSETTPVCATAQDPICGARSGGNENVCTPEVDSAGGVPSATEQTSPASKAQRFINCLCSDPRP